MKNEKSPDVMDYRSSGDEKYLHCKHTAEFHIGEDYDWLLDKGIKRVGVNIFRAIILLLLEIIDRVGFGLKIKGKENIKDIAGGAVIVCNHVHPMDCTFVALTMGLKRTYFLTLESNFCIPVIGKIIRALLAVPVSENPLKLIKMFSNMNDALQKGNFVAVFPEADLIPYERDIREFKDGAFHMAVKANVPIIPMTVTFRRPKGLFRLFKRRPCAMLNISKPIYPDSSLAKKQAAERIKAQCHEVMRRVSDE